MAHSVRSRILQLVTLLAVALGGLFVSGATASASIPTEKVLSYQFQWQANGYYCGPAAVRIALTARGYTYSQSTLAAALGTTTNGTNSASDTTRVLNSKGNTSFYETKWIPGSYATSAEKARLKYDVTYDIPRGYPLVVNIVGTAVDTDGDAHSYSGGHYMTVVGYKNSGDIVKLADPADANGYGWYWMTTNRLADWIALRGYSA
ncbi:C39 family peptidase [Labedaea rhizosphaerae]|uniref:Peptidase C39-like protein n=1 Tax=Labedaea rhizosphaerae TaxID=598644 RepID=A0A4R6SKM5_LABRH|nr:C39 family peptidase [Labedaea rhizosphaerae]TDQ04414.1 peptidase C39-like protein [Labedaea rhizosphaerae]